MLVLTRKIGERIVINGNIYVTVQSVERRGEPKFRVSVEAPPNVPVHREEVQIAIDAQEGGGR